MTNKVSKFSAAATKLNGKASKETPVFSLPLIFLTPISFQSVVSYKLVVYIFPVKTVAINQAIYLKAKAGQRLNIFEIFKIVMFYGYDYYHICIISIVLLPSR